MFHICQLVIVDRRKHVTGICNRFVRTVDKREGIYYSTSNNAFIFFSIWKRVIDYGRLGGYRFEDVSRKLRRQEPSNRSPPRCAFTHLSRRYRKWAVSVLLKLLTLFRAGIYILRSDIIVEGNALTVPVYVCVCVCL